MEVFLERVDGLTYKEIIELAESDLPYNKEYNIRQINSRIAKLEKDRKNAKVFENVKPFYEVSKIEIV